MVAFTPRVVLVSLLAVPVCYLFDCTAHSRHPTSLFALAAFLIAVVVPVVTYAVLFFGDSKRADLYCYVFTLFAFTSVIDLVLALTIHGKLTVLNFYLDEGEPYLHTGHGMFINYWDATFHYACYIVLVVQLHQTAHLPLAEGSMTRQVGLVWFGSIMNSLVVFLPGNVIGRFAEHVKPSYFLNVPFLLFPITFLVQRVCRYVPDVSTTGAPNGYAKRGANLGPNTRDSLEPYDTVNSSLGSILSFGIVLTGVASVLIFAARATFVLARYKHPWLDVEPYLLDSTEYPRLQMLTYAFYGIPFAVAVLARWVAADEDIDFSSTRWVKDCSSLYLGALLQGQFSYIGAAMVNPPNAREHPALGSFVWKPVPEGMGSLFWLVNLTPLVFGLLLWSSCHLLAPRTRKGKTE